MKNRLDFYQVSWYQFFLCFINIHFKVEMKEAYGNDIYCLGCNKYLGSFFLRDLDGPIDKS